jgi:peptide/nickel transport system substrate-binding protein
MIPFLRRCVSLLLVGLMAIALSGCSVFALRTEAAQVPQLVLSLLSDPKTFNPALNNEFPNIFLFTHRGLTEQDGYGVLHPALAESWEISPDNQRVVFQLRKGLKWSDGKPLTADDVVFSYQDVYFNEEIPSDARDVFRIGTKGLLPTVKKLDDLRVEFTLPEPFAPFLRSVESGYILPAHMLREAVETKDADGKPKFLTTWGTDTDPTKIVVNGPFQMESYVTSQRVVFRRNPYYWEKDEQGRQKPYIERVIWQIVESPDTDVLKFRSGEIDILGAFSVIRVEDFSLLKREEKRGKFHLVLGGPRAGTLFLTFNLNTGRRKNGQPVLDPIKSRWFNTVAFRQAVAYAIDRQAMINRTFRGFAQTQDSPISVQSPYYLSPKEGLKSYTYNPEKAKELLLGAGFKYDSRNQLLDADGNPVRFTMITNAGNKTRESLGVQIRQDLSKIGIQVNFQPIAFNTLLDKMDNSMDWEALILGFTGSVEPNDGFNLWNPDGASHLFNQKPQPGREPLQGRTVADWERRIGDLYIQAAQELDEAKRKELYAETQRLTQEYLPFVYLVNQETIAAVRDRVQGVEYTALKGAYWNLEDQRIADK